MEVLNTGMIEKRGCYFIIEEIKNTRKISKILKKEYPKLYRYYRLEPYVYRNISTNIFIDITNFQNCKFINIRNIASQEFVESEFFQNHEKEIVDIIKDISYKKRNEYYIYTTTIYDIFKTKEFLTSDFARKHYKEIFDTIDNIIEEKEQTRKVENTHKQVLSLKMKNK